MLSDLQNIAIILASLLVAAGVAWILCRLIGDQAVDLPGRRLGCVDGFRGYLALLVFTHHFIYTYFFKTTGVWGSPYNYFASCVGVFFMVTGFLFLRRFLKSRVQTHWRNFFLARFFRLIPLYAVIVIVILVIAADATGFVAAETPGLLVRDVMRWVFFYGFRVNGFSDTSLIIAGVDWTLRYECLFYISLPLIAALLRYRYFAVIASAACIGLSIFPFRIGTSYFSSAYLILFMLGGVAAKISLSIRIPEKWIRHPLASVLSIAALVAACTVSKNPEGTLPAVFLFVFFLPIALGNSLFGLLEWRASRFLGEISYSIYLMHGLVLYVLFSLAFPAFVKRLDFLTYECLMPIVISIVVGLAWATYRLIEKPGVRLGDRLSACLDRKPAVVRPAPSSPA